MTAPQETQPVPESASWSRVADQAVPVTDQPSLGEKRIDSWHLTWGRRRWERRHFVILLLVLGLAATYCVGWVGWVRVNTELQFHQQPPGATASWDGVEFRVVSLQQVPTLDRGFEESGEPLPGSIWIEAVLEVRGATAEVSGGCSLKLLGPGGRQWESELS